MPLIILTGYPSSGKSTITQKLKSFFEETGVEVHVISEEEQILKASFDKNSVYEGNYNQML